MNFIAKKLTLLLLAVGLFFGMGAVAQAAPEDGNLTEQQLEQAKRILSARGEMRQVEKRGNIAPDYYDTRPDRGYWRNDRRDYGYGYHHGGHHRGHGCW